MAWDGDLFARIGDNYDLVFADEVSHTQTQAAFAMRSLGLRPGQRLLDVGCGPGRHALALCRQGLAVTGLDRDARLLALARSRAKAAGLGVQWVEADARHMPRLGPFHGAMCLFASWGSIEDPACDRQILASVATRLVPGGRFLLDVPHLDWLREHPYGHIRCVAGGIAVRETRHFDRDQGVVQTTWRICQPGRAPWTLQGSSRVYALAELEWLLSQAGLVLEAACGGYDGSALTSSARRCLVLARRPVLPAAQPVPAAPHLPTPGPR